MVIYRTADGQPGYHETEGLDEAVSFVEQLRNQQSVDGARIFRLEEVSFDFRPYFKVEIGPDGMAADEPLPAAPEPAGADWSAAAPEPAPLPGAEESVPAEPTPLAVEPMPEPVPDAIPEPAAATPTAEPAPVTATIEAPAPLDAPAGDAGSIFDHPPAEIPDGPVLGGPPAPPVFEGVAADLPPPPVFEAPPAPVPPVETASALTDEPAPDGGEDIAPEADEAEPAASGRRGLFGR